MPSMLVSESLHHFINEEFIAYQILNERFDINSIRNYAKKALVLATLFILSTGNPKIPKEQLSKSPIIQQLANKPYISQREILLGFSQLAVNFMNTSILKDYNQLSISKSGLEFIKDHEKFASVAYALGDGKITIGYGHAEPERTANFKVGDEISENDAIKLFYLDVKEAEDGVRRLFKMWEEQGLDVKVSQHMWDSMVSMAFNMGVNGFRGSEIVKYLKQENYFQAANKIPDTKIENADQFPGLIQRRELEKDLFLKDLFII